MEAKTITVKLKDEDKTTNHKSLIYEEIKLSSDDTILKGCVREALKSFDGIPDSAQITIKMEYFIEENDLPPPQSS